METRDPDAYLCKICEGQLTAVQTLEAKLISVKSKITDSLNSLHSVGGAGVAPKRSRPQEGARPPLEKRTRTASPVCTTSASSVHPNIPVQPQSGISPAVQVCQVKHITAWGHSAYIKNVGQNFLPKGRKESNKCEDPCAETWHPTISSSEL